MMRTEARVRAARAWLVEMLHTAAQRGEMELCGVLLNAIEDLDWVLGVAGSELERLLPAESVLAEMEAKLNRFEQQGFDDAKSTAPPAAAVRSECEVRRALRHFKEAMPAAMADPSKGYGATILAMIDFIDWILLGPSLFDHVMAGWAAVDAQEAEEKGGAGAPGGVQ
jgi:hypothetical protein